MKRRGFISLVSAIPFVGKLLAHKQIDARQPLIIKSVDMDLLPHLLGCLGLFRESANQTAALIREHNPNLSVVELNEITMIIWARGERLDQARSTWDRWKRATVCKLHQHLHWYVTSIFGLSVRYNRGVPDGVVRFVSDASVHVHTPELVHGTTSTSLARILD